MPQVRLGVVRCYLTRHGPGPFVTEDPALELPEPHNLPGTWQGAFRVGHLDAVALRYAADVSGVDVVALTHLDTAAGAPLRLCRSYQVDGRRLDRIIPGPERDLAWQERLTRMLPRARPVYAAPGRDWPGVVEDVLGAPVVLRSHGPTASDKQAVGPASTWHARRRFPGARAHASAGAPPDTPGPRSPVAVHRVSRLRHSSLTR